MTVARALFAALLVGTLSAGSAIAQEPPPSVASRTIAATCEFGLVLSGGGARGVAHLGVLEVFEEHGIIPDCIVGASMGAIVGSLYASGHSIETIRALLGAFSWKTVFTEANTRSAQPILHRLESQRSAVRVGIGEGGVSLPRSIFSDAMINRLLIEHLAPANFEARRDFAALPIPFRTVGTDLKTGKRIVLANGDLARAVRASMSVPIAYGPIKWGDALLVDGGLVDNVPVSLAHELGATYTVAVDVSTPVADDVNADILGVTKRLIDLLFAANNNENQVNPELTVLPDLGDHSFADYSNYDVLIEAGREAARQAIAQIPQRYQHRPQRRVLDERVFGGRQIASIQVSGQQYLPARIVRRELVMVPGTAFDFEKAMDGLDHLYSTGLVQEAWLDIKPLNDDEVELAVYVVDQYRHTLDLGLAYQNDDLAQGYVRFETRSPFGGAERLHLTGFGSSRDVYGSFGLRTQDLFGGHLGYGIELQVHKEKPKVFDADGVINRAQFDRRHAKATVGLPLGRQHLLEAGVLIGQVEIVEQLGLPYENRTDTQRLVLGRYVWDDLSSVVLPERGQFLRALVEHNFDSLGADYQYTFLDVYGRAVRRAGPLVLDARLRYGYSDGDLPVYEQFRIGGPDLIPGVSRGELWGDQAIGASLTVGVDLISLLRIYARGGFGNTWNSTRDISFGSTIKGGGIGATIASPIGPIQLDYGWAEGGRNRFYLSFGRQVRDIRDITR